MKTPTDKSPHLSARFALFCDYVLISRDGKLSLIGEFDRLFSQSDTAVLGWAFFVSKLRGEASTEIEVEISLQSDKTHEVLFKNQMGVKLDERGNAGIMIEMANVTFKEFGAYKAIITHQDKRLAEAELEVVKVKAPSVARS